MSRSQTRRRIMAETSMPASSALGPPALVVTGDWRGRGSSVRAQAPPTPSACVRGGCRYPPGMPTRATKRGEERTPLEGRYDVLVCGASFAGLAVARELSGTGAEVLVVDRYEIGERQTSACGIPTDWMRKLNLMEAECQRFDSLLIHSPHGERRYRLPWTFSTFDYRRMCELLWADCDASFETAKVNGRAASRRGDDLIHVDTDRGVLSSPLVVDALGWRRNL